MNAELAALVKRRIESRYRRLVFVHEELERLNALAKLEPAAKRNAPVEKASAPLSNNNLSNRSFEDFVFSRINFSIYKKIDTEEFELLFRDGLFDYDNTFYREFFSINRTEAQKIINASYVKAGPVYLCKKSSPLLLSIMRTVHTSLDFAPLLGCDDASDAEEINAAAGELDGLTIRHKDGMETRLFVPEPSAVQKKAVLCGTFHPLGKACTITLI